MPWGKQALKWTELPIRTARKGAAHDCNFCMKPITVGQKYYDGGPSKRAHVEHVGEMKEQPGRPERIKVTYVGDLDEDIDNALDAALAQLGYVWGDSGFTFATRVRDLSFRLEE